MPWPKNRHNLIPCKVRNSRQRSCNGREGLVVCNNRDLEPLALPNGLALGCYQPFPEVSIVSYFFSFPFENDTIRNLLHDSLVGVHFLSLLILTFYCYVNRVIVVPGDYSRASDELKLKDKDRTIKSITIYSLSLTLRLYNEKKKNFFKF